MKERPILFSAPMVRAILEGPVNKIFISPGEITDLYDHGFTIKEISILYGTSVEPVKRILRETGIQRRPAKQRLGIFSGDRNPSWRGGRRVREDGYIMRWTPSGERLEHRIKMEEKYGRSLLPYEVVHHLNGNKGDNRPENLSVMTQCEHARIHAPEMHESRYRT